MARPRDLQIAALVLGILILGFSLWWFSNQVEGFQNADGTSADPDLANVVLPTSDVVGLGFLIHGSMNEITSKVPFFISSFKNIYDVETPSVAWSAPNAVDGDTTIRVYLMESKEPFTLTPEQVREVVLTLKRLSREYFNRENAIAVFTEDGVYPTLEVGAGASAPEEAAAAPEEAAPAPEEAAAAPEETASAPEEAAAVPEEAAAAPEENTL